MQVFVTDGEQQILIRWKKRGDSLILIQLKAETIFCASHGVDLGFIAEMVGRTVRTVKEWLSAWRASRLHSVGTGHAKNENAARLTRDQKEQLKEILSRPLSQSSIKAEFWDVPALADVVRENPAASAIRAASAQESESPSPTRSHPTQSPPRPRSSPTNP
ncbi:helix-turn-helix domain-containing protein [Actinomyces bowdenii]|uniref:helix-turn-helix domain-containing protein n=1 Tax=Actinomyces bowdenii TaxID=131109 RepID=UPI00214B94D4|nr:helix-turn-helix domain-containing protein [Actinomyces bowdenii]MCR2053597.1 helix-turn-helix domain-containing protein [Actinomyces bowdenii]